MQNDKININITRENVIFAGIVSVTEEIGAVRRALSSADSRVVAVSRAKLGNGIFGYLVAIVLAVSADMEIYYVMRGNDIRGGIYDLLVREEIGACGKLVELFVFFAHTRELNGSSEYLADVLDIFVQ